MKKDIRQYSNRELYLIIFNNEELYKQRHRSDFISLLSELFVYTNAQLRTLKLDLKQDKRAA